AICCKESPCTHLQEKLLSATRRSNVLVFSRRFMGWITALRLLIACEKALLSRRRKMTMRFSLFSVLDYYEDGSRTLATLYADLLDQMVEAERLGFDAYCIGEL